MTLPFKGLFYEVSYLAHSQGPIGDGRRLPCMDMELNSVECLEAYGLSKGRLMCAKYLEDVQECKMGRIRRMRNYLMRHERFKKIASGEISWAQRWGRKYDYDSFVQGTFYP